MCIQEGNLCVTAIPILHFALPAVIIYKQLHYKRLYISDVRKKHYDHI